MTRSPGYTNGIIQELCRLSEKAGREAMRFYKGRVSVEVKADSSPLTEADRASHDLLMQFLPGVIPGVPVISEESEASAHHSRGRSFLAGGST